MCISLDTLPLPQHDGRTDRTGQVKQYRALHADAR